MRIFSSAILFFFIVCSPPAARADFEYRLENYFSASGQQISDATWNTTNRLLILPQATASMDLRPDFQWSWRNFKIVFRPRFQGFYDSTFENSPNNQIYNSHGNFNVTDAYAEGTLSRDISYDIGLQVYQWGPAELLSPSNPIYHFRSDQRSAFYKEKGHALVRINWIHNNLSLVAISEPVSNNEAYFESATPFQSKNLIKLEYQNAEQRSDYFGFVAGSEMPNSVFFGEYANFSPFDGCSLYVDAKHPQYVNNYTTYSDSFGYTYLDSVNTSRQWYTIMDAGVRYEGDWDWRLEYIYNSPGFTPAQFQQAYQSTYNLSPYIVNNISRFAASGLELFGQNYVYFSLRMPDLGARKKINLAFRYLYSAMDGSGGAQFDFDRALSDGLVSYVEFTGALGAQNTELTLINRAAGFVGLKWVL